MSNQLTRRDFAIRTAGFGLALGLAPAATLAEAEQASRSETSPAVADPYSLVDPELLPTLKQFPAFDFSAEMVSKFRQTPELGIDRSRIAVGGESAGGGHAASLAIHARDRNEVPIVFQLLIYSQLDDRTGSSHPAPPAIGQFMWTASANRFAWSSLLGVPAGSSKVPVAAVPARVASVASLPPAWIGVGSIDLFAEEDMEYARRLVHAGVATELLVVCGAFHGFDLLVPDAEVSQQFSASWKSALRKAFATGKADIAEKPKASRQSSGQ